MDKSSERWCWRWQNSKKTKKVSSAAEKLSTVKDGFLNKLLKHRQQLTRIKEHNNENHGKYEITDFWKVGIISLGIPVPEHLILWQHFWKEIIGGGGGAFEERLICVPFSHNLARTLINSIGIKRLARRLVSLVLSWVSLGILKDLVPLANPSLTICGFQKQRERRKEKKGNNGQKQQKSEHKKSAKVPKYQKWTNGSVLWTFYHQKKQTAQLFLQKDLFGIFLLKGANLSVFPCFSIQFLHPSLPITNSPQTMK